MARRLLAVLAGLAALYLAAALALASHLGEPDEVYAYAALPAFIAAHLLHRAGVPGMLERGGLCGWGWCEPTALGWLASVLLLAAGAALLAAACAWGWQRLRRDRTA